MRAQSGFALDVACDDAFVGHKIKHLARNTVCLLKERTVKVSSPRGRYWSNGISTARRCEYLTALHWARLSPLSKGSLLAARHQPRTLSSFTVHDKPNSVLD